MSGENPKLEERVDTLTRQVEELTRRVERLSAVAGITTTAASPRIAPSKEEADVSEEVLTWAGKAAVLPRLSTLCFLLVIALILRTVTDHQMINTFAGSFLGMGYAAALMGAGWYLYAKGNLLAPVSAACGAVLMSVIVVETHTRFGSLPSEPAYALLVTTGIAMAVMSRRFNAIIPISLGTLGMCLAGAAIDFPRPFFLYPAVVLLIANVLGYIAGGIQRCTWLRWILLLVSLTVLHLWSVALGIAFARHEVPPPALAPEWFFPVIALFAVTYPSLAFLGFLRVGTGTFSRYVVLLPTVSAAVLFMAAHQIVSSRGSGTALLGIAGIFAAGAHLAAAHRLSLRRIPGAPGTNSFAFAAAVLLALALPAAAGKPLFILPALSLGAFGLAFAAKIWESGGIRVTSYLLQVFACGFLVFALHSNSDVTFSVAGAVAAAAIVVVTILHYRWSRANAPPAPSEYFGKFDREDRSASAVLAASLVAGFFMIRVGLYQALALFPEGTGDPFRSGQTILINVSAAALMMYALSRRNREIRNVAILVTIVGAVKVFLYDLIGLHGMSLVLSVFSFGLAAAIESTALGRWQRGREQHQ